MATKDGALFVTTGLDGGTRREYGFSLFVGPDGTEKNGLEVEVSRFDSTRYTVKIKRRGLVRVKLFNEPESLATFLFRVTPRISFFGGVGIVLASLAGLVGIAYWLAVLP